MENCNLTFFSTAKSVTEYVMKFNFGIFRSAASFFANILKLEYEA